MNRVLIVGCPGAGKSTFAKKLSKINGLPLVHLDQHYWRSGWIEPDNNDSWVAQVTALIMPPNWILDGNYGRTFLIRLARADTVIFFDMNRYLCIWQVLMRTIKHFGRTRNDMATNCPERFNWPFLKYTWHFSKKHRPQLIDALRQFDGEQIFFKHRNEVNQYLVTTGKRT